MKYCLRLSAALLASLLLLGCPGEAPKTHDHGDGHTHDGTDHKH